MGQQMILSTTKVLDTQTALTATANSTAFTLPLADSYALFLSVTGATGTTPTLDVILETSPDGGTTWLNLPLRFTQATAASQAYIRFQYTMGFGEAASAGTAAATGGALAANIPFIGGQNTTVLGASAQVATMRLGYTVSGTTPSCAFKVYAIISGRGNSIS